MTAARAAAAFLALYAAAVTVGWLRWGRGDLDTEEDEAG